MNQLINKLQFLAGGGEMGELVREKDWGTTVLGDPGYWPLGLRTSLSILLNSKFPMFLWWGPELTCFYNDAYRPSLGNDGKHPFILGVAAEEAWTEIWHIIKPLIDKVLNEGESVWFEDMLVPIYRNGKIEDVYWTFSYSPVFGDESKPEGVLVTCTETTEKVLIKRQLIESDRKLRLIINQAPVAIGIFRGSNYSTEMANSKALELWGRQEAEVLNKPLLEVMPELREQGIDQLLDEVYKTGKSFSAVELPVQILRKGNLETCYINFNYEALFDEHGNIDGIMAIGADVTVQVLAHKNVEINEERLNIVIDASELGTWELNLQSGEINYSNKYLEILGFEPGSKPQHADLVKHIHPGDLPIREKAIAAAMATGYLNYRSRVIWDDQSIHWFEGKGKLFYDVNNKPLKLLGTIRDITAEKKHEEELEQSKQRFRNLIIQSPIPTLVFKGPEHIIEIVSSSMLKRWNKTEQELLNKKFTAAFPDITDQRIPLLLDQVYNTGKSYREIESVSFIQDKSGFKTFYVDFEYSPLMEPDGTVSGIIAIVNDVTESVEARHKVEESEKRYLNLIMQSPVAKAILKGKDHVVEMANEALLKNIWRKQESAVVGKRLLDIFPELQQQRYGELLDKVYTTGEKWKETESLITVLGDDGLKDFYVDVEYAPVIEPDKSITGIKITTIDVTEKVEARLKTEKSEQKFRLLADSMPQHIWTSDPQGNLNYYNQSVFDYSGLTPEQINKDGWLQIVHPDDREANTREWLNSISTGRDFLFEHRFRKHTGEYRWQLSRAIPQRDDLGNIQMWVGASTDIQEIKELEKQKDLFISMASHELKTPITSIKGYVQILQSLHQDNSDVFLKNSLAIIDKQVVILTSLISDLLDLSKIKSDSISFNKEDFLLNELVLEIIDEIKHIHPGHTLLLTSTETIRVFADRNRIGQVLINFLTNAVKYAPGSTEIQVSVAVKNANVIVSVKDFGIGINRDDQKKIFERFYRVEGKNEKKFPGFGIGLFIASEIIRKHDGNIGVESKPGEGSVFYFSLPLQKD